MPSDCGLCWNAARARHGSPALAPLPLFVHIQSVTPSSRLPRDGRPIESPGTQEGRRRDVPGAALVGGGRRALAMAQDQIRHHQRAARSALSRLHHTASNALRECQLRSSRRVRNVAKVHPHSAFCEVRSSAQHLRNRRCTHGSACTHLASPSCTALAHIPARFWPPRDTTTTVAELLFGVQAFWHGAHSPPSVNPAREYAYPAQGIFVSPLSPSTESTSSSASTDAPGEVPPIDRLIFARADADGWRNNPGFNAYFLRAALPGPPLPHLRRRAHSLPRPARLALPHPPPHGPLRRARRVALQLADAAHGGSLCGSQTQHIAAEALGEMRKRRQVVGGRVGGWWELLGAVGRFAGRSGVIHMRRAAVRKFNTGSQRQCPPPQRPKPLQHISPATDSRNSLQQDGRALAKLYLHRPSSALPQLYFISTKGSHVCHVTLALLSPERRRLSPSLSLPFPKPMRSVHMPCHCALASPPSKGGHGHRIQQTADPPLPCTLESGGAHAADSPTRRPTVPIHAHPTHAALQVCTPRHSPAMRVAGVKLSRVRTNCATSSRALKPRRSTAESKSNVRWASCTSTVHARAQSPHPPRAVQCALVARHCVRNLITSMRKPACRCPLRLLPLPASAHSIARPTYHVPRITRSYSSYSCVRIAQPNKTNFK
ncbi:hypothetical protein DFH06DRAFT_1484227, partial [Mycena polygramma]